MKIFENIVQWILAAVLLLIVILTIVIIFSIIPFACSYLLVLILSWMGIIDFSWKIVIGLFLINIIFNISILKK